MGACEKNDDLVRENEVRPGCLYIFVQQVCLPMYDKETQVDLSQYS